MARPSNTVARLLKLYVEKTPTCWLWRGTLTDGRYCQASVGDLGLGAARLFYEHARGAIPRGEVIHQSCKNILCVNPAHLEALTVTEVTRRGNSPAGINFRKTHCIHGHPLHGGNLYTTPAGARQCRTCQRLREQKSRAKNRTQP